MILISLPRIKYSLGVDGSFIYCPWNCYIYELTALGEITSQKVEKADEITYECATPYIPKKYTIFHKFIQVIRIRIKRKEVLQKGVIPEVSVDVLDKRSLLRLVYSVKKCGGASFEKGG